MKKVKLILSLLNRREKRQLIFVLIAMLIMGFVELVGVGSISPFISIVSNPEVIHTNKYLSSAYTYLNFSSAKNFIIFFGVVIIIVLALCNVCLAGVSALIYFYSGKRYHSISMRLLEKYLRQPYVYYLNVNTSDLTKKIHSDVNTFVNRILITFLQLISSVVIAVFIIALLIVASPILAVFTSVLFSLVYVVIFTSVRKFLAKKGSERVVYNSLKYKYINEIFGGIKDIKILGKEGVFLKLFSMPSKKYAMSEAVSELFSEIPKYLLETIAFGSILGIIIFMVIGGTTINEFLPVLTVYAVGAYRLLPVLQKIFRSVASMKYHFPVVKILYKDLHELSDGEILTYEDIPRMEFCKNICLRNITFQYPNVSRNVINSQILVVAANTSIALVGATGCGKTTFVDIILGLLLPAEGKILVDNIEVNDENRKNWQRNIGYVPQLIYLTDDSIKNNIAFGIAPEKIDDDAVIKAAKLANIHDFIINELEDGYSTVVGERGVRLSGGQRQRIGIARAVYHDPSVLILDEATSALDGLTENAIMDAIKNLSHKKTIIMIAHRLTTVKHCDIIYMMDKGVFSDQGSYEELYSRNSLFRKMAEGI
jgi:ABC-type multidrug transport system fused ATPase/permease subunit